jgi:hypothetical protein
MPRGLLRMRQLVSNADRLVRGTRMARVRVGRENPSARQFAYDRKPIAADIFSPMFMVCNGVMSAISTSRQPLPVYPYQRTFSAWVSRSQTGQKATLLILAATITETVSGSDRARLIGSSFNGSKVNPFGFSRDYTIVGRDIGRSKTVFA